MANGFKIVDPEGQVFMSAWRCHNSMDEAQAEGRHLAWSYWRVIEVPEAELTELDKADMRRDRLQVHFN